MKFSFQTLKIGAVTSSEEEPRRLWFDSQINFWEKKSGGVLSSLQNSRDKEEWFMIGNQSTSRIRDLEIYNLSAAILRYRQKSGEQFGHLPFALLRQHNFVRNKTIIHFPCTLGLLNSAFISAELIAYVEPDLMLSKKEPSWLAIIFNEMAVISDSWKISTLFISRIVVCIISHVE